MKNKPNPKPKKITFIYLVQLDDGAQWAFRKKEDAVELMEKRLYMTKVKGVRDAWGIPRYSNKADLITIELQ